MKYFYAIIVAFVLVTVAQAAEYTTRTSTRCTPLMEAIASGNKEIVQEIIKAGVELDAQDQFNQTGLFLAVQREDLVIARMLICAGAKIDREDVSHETPLIQAIKQQNIPMITMLVTMGADPFYRTSTGATVEDAMPMNTIVKRSLEDAIAQGRKTRTDEGLLARIIV